jgi:60 kDa SS-A/Ro ribonucleoprotein
MNKEVKLRDALFLTHPKPVDKAMKELFEKIASDTLEIPYTWETELSNAGQIGKSKKLVWEELICSGKLGFMALLRNIRNLLQEGVSGECLCLVCQTLSNRDQVLKSKQMPYRFLSAYRSIVCGDSDVNQSSRGYSAPVIIGGLKSPVEDVQRVLDSLETAIGYSVENLPMFNGEKVLVATDVSGSMITNISPKSMITLFDIGAMFAMIATKACDGGEAGMFGNDFKILDTKNVGILESVQDIYQREGEVGYSTNGWKVLDYAHKTDRKFDRIMIFTDCQMYDIEGQENAGYSRSRRGSFTFNERWQTYRSLNPDAKLYLFDLSGYGQSPVRVGNNGVFHISGFSDRVFDILHRIELGEGALEEIDAIMI